MPEFVRKDEEGQWPVYLSIYELESSIENIACGPGEQKIAFLNTRWQKFPETLTWRPSLPLY